MVWPEIILILIGIAFIVGSFYITEKLSQDDLDKISLMNQVALKKISEKQVDEMKRNVENTLDNILDETLEVTKRGLEKETNKKIMAVSEYSDTVLENINKSHNEITFLYSMLNEKQAETAQMVGDLQKLTKQIRDLDLETTIVRLEDAANHAISIEQTFEPICPERIEQPENVVIIKEINEIIDVQEDSEDIQELTKNERILVLYKEGKDEVEIAKTLDCGLGEVRLVLGLYNNEA